MEVLIAPMARRDIASILAWTLEHFGRQTSKRYAKLITTAIEQLAENPVRAGSSPRPEIAQHCRTYHLYFSRRSAGRANNRIRQPRHFLLYRIADANTLEISRVLHDSMDLRANLPEDFRSSPE